MGVGLMEGFQKGVNWKMFAKQFASWVSTLFVVGLGVGAVFAQVRGALDARGSARCRMPAVLMWWPPCLPVWVQLCTAHPLWLGGLASGSLSCCANQGAAAGVFVSHRLSTAPARLMVARCCNMRTAWQLPTRRCCPTSTHPCSHSSKRRLQVRTGLSCGLGLIGADDCHMLLVFCAHCPPHCLCWGCYMLLLANLGGARTRSHAFCSAAAAAGGGPLLGTGALRTLPPSQWDKLNATLAEAAKVNQDFTNTKGNTAVQPSSVLKSVNQSIALFQDNSVFSLGQNQIYPGAPVCNPTDAAAIKSNAKVPCQSPPIVSAGKMEA